MKLAERMASVETEVRNIKDNNIKEHREILDKLDKFICSADNKYAPKWITKVLGWGAGVLGAVIAGVSVTLAIRGF